MTEYSNPQIPEGINVSAEHPLKDFFVMLAGIGLALAVAIILLSVFAQYLVRFIPFEVEQVLVANVERWQTQLPETTSRNEPPATQQASATELHKVEVRAYLQQLADRLLAQVPDPLPVTVHYLDSDMINAFATLGGQVFITRGLLNIMPDENALAMVLAHEIAHVQHRDPIVALGRGLTVSLALICITGNGDGALAQQLLGQVNLLVDLRFSRSAESAADEAALDALLQLYGHVASADQLFVFLQQHQGDEAIEWFSTHPLNTQRIAMIEGFAAEHHAPDMQTTPLPDWLQTALPEQPNAQ